ncbi:MAG: tetratricopeptide repeat protein, partial [Eggerthellaceae bacterium]|nr:tetratricopeptide repeat protein [Eggerthellaceae bacterium]
MSFSHRYALSAVAALVLAGCGPSDGTEELAEGRAAYELRDLGKAEKLFGECLAAAPENVDALVYMARVKLDLGEVDAAREWIGTAAARAGDDGDVRLGQAQTAGNAKDS